ncbi:MAG: DUF998 domain-containing protein [Chitinophagales bacterium]
MKNLAETENQLIISYIALRRAIGWLGILLPLILLFSNMVIYGCDRLIPSISHYYYTRAGDVFVGVLCAVGIFLLCYKGYETTPEGKPDNMDRIISSAAGLMAIGVALFPTNISDDTACDVMTLNDNGIRDTMHYIFAGLFFLLLAYMAFFRFTISKHPRAEWGERKIMRNRMYKFCGVVIVLSLLLIAVSGFVEGVENLHLTFWLEWVALIAFGSSWLVKGELILKDN